MESPNPYALLLWTKLDAEIQELKKAMAVHNEDCERKLKQQRGEINYLLEKVNKAEDTKHTEDQNSYKRLNNIHERLEKLEKPT